MPCLDVFQCMNFFLPLTMIVMPLLSPLNMPLFAFKETFNMLVASGELTVDADADHTVRLKVTDLDPFTRYYYRFHARHTPSMRSS